MGNYLDHPIFICGHRKSGTTVLINLFDGSNDAVVYPDDSTFFYMYFPEYVEGDVTLDEQRERMAEFMLGQVHRKKIDQANCSDEQREKMLQALDEFKKEVYTWEKEDFSLKNVLQNLIAGYNKYFQQVEEPKVWIEKTTSTEIFAQQLLATYPNAKFIHNLRDPRDNWASLLSGWEKRYQYYNDDVNQLKQSLIERGRLGFEMAIANQKIMGEDRYKVIKYEDLTSAPRHYISELANFIGIDYSDDFLYPSTFGYPWEGNNFDGQRFSQISPTNVSRWQDRIFDEDAALIEFHFKTVMDHYGYERMFNDKDCVKAASEHYKWFNFYSSQSPSNV